MLTAQPVLKTQTIKEKPPEVLIQTINEPVQKKLVVTKDIIESRNDYIQAFQSCSAEIVGLREWYGF